MNLFCSNMAKTVLVTSVICLASESVIADTGDEPWKPWLSASTDSIKIAAPTDSNEQEIEAIEQELANLDDHKKANVLYWQLPNPNYRWMQMALSRYEKGPPSPWKGRGLALLNVAIYDAVAVATTAKSEFRRARPAVDSTLIPTPDSYSYPSAHAAAAGAAAAVLTYLFPEDGDYFMSQARLAAEARVHAGINYPSDTEAGLSLGAQVSDYIVDYAKTDNSDSEWTGTRPQGPDKLQGELFVHPNAGEWKPWTIESTDAFIPERPAPIDSDEIAAQLEELKAIERNIPNSIRAWLNHSTVRAYQWWYERLGTYVFEKGNSMSTPEIALVYAAVSTSNHDAIIACFKAKYTYWFIRPAQLDTSLNSLFPNPPHPSYPAAHSCSSMNYATTIGYFFPEQEPELIAAAEEAGYSRLIAGIHYPMDKVVGEMLGKGVAAQAISYVNALQAE